MSSRRAEKDRRSGEWCRGGGPWKGLEGPRTDAQAVRRIESIPGSFNYLEVIEDPLRLRELDADTSLFHAIVVRPRPGGELFATYLEHRHYRPHTAANRAFQLRAIVWDEIVFMMVSIPLSDMGWAREAAEYAGLRLVDALPATIIGGTDPPVGHFWPMKSPRAMTLENAVDSDFYARRGITSLDDPGPRGLAAWERAECDRINAESRRRHLEEFGPREGT